MIEEIPINSEPTKKISVLDVEKYRIHITDQIPKPDTVLSVNGKVISTRKNIFGITGKAKVGKSFLMALLNAAVLNKGEFGVLSSYLPKGKDKIIYIDTEQSDYHVSLALHRIKDMISEYKIDNLMMYAFDAVPTSERYTYTEHLINNTEGVGLVIIDGIADLVKTVNDEIIACDMADTLRRWATINDIAIGYVLHQNPSDSAKMRGHLGTVLMNKSETVIQISSSKENDAIKVVETTQTRNAKPDDWSFEIIDGMPTIMDECYQAPKAGRKPQKTLTNIEKYQLLTSIYTGHYQVTGIGYSVLLEMIKEEYTKIHGDIGDNKIKELVKYCKEMKWICQDNPRGNWLLYPFEL